MIFTIPVQKTLYTNFNGCAWSEADIAHQSVSMRATRIVAASIRPREVTAPAIDQNTPWPDDNPAARLVYDGQGRR